MINLHIQYPL